jgi:hypothetical protein
MFAGNKMSLFTLTLHSLKTGSNFLEITLLEAENKNPCLSPRTGPTVHRSEEAVKLVMKPADGDLYSLLASSVVILARAGE